MNNQVKTPLRKRLKDDPSAEPVAEPVAPQVLRLDPEFLSVLLDAVPTIPVHFNSGSPTYVLAPFSRRTPARQPRSKSQLAST